MWSSHMKMDPRNIPLHYSADARLIYENHVGIFLSSRRHSRIFWYLTTSGKTWSTRVVGRFSLPAANLPVRRPFTCSLTLDSSVLCKQETTLHCSKNGSLCGVLAIPILLVDLEGICRPSMDTPNHWRSSFGFPKSERSSRKRVEILWRSALSQIVP